VGLKGGQGPRIKQPQPRKTRATRQTKTKPEKFITGKNAQKSMKVPNYEWPRKPAAEWWARRKGFGKQRERTAAIDKATKGNGKKKKDKPGGLRAKRRRRLEEQFHRKRGDEEANRV